MSNRRVTLITGWPGYSLVAYMRLIKERVGIEGIDFFDVSKEDNYSGEDLHNVVENSTDVLFFVNEQFAFNCHWLETFLNFFNGRVVNKNLWGQHRWNVYRRWRDEGINVPQQIKGPINDLDDVPFGPPYIIRRQLGHGGSSRQTFIETNTDLNTWVEEWKTTDYLLEEFVDTSLYGFKYQARVTRIGDKLIPKNVTIASDWYCQPENRNNADIHKVYEGLNCLYKMPFYVDEKKLFKIFEAQGNEILSLEFSFLNGEIIPWEVNYPFDFVTDCPDTKEATPEIVELQQELINSFLHYFGLDCQVDYEQAKSLYEEFCAYEAPLDRSHPYRTWEGLCPLKP